MCDKPAKFAITAPKEMQGLSESCLEIPCDFPLPREFDGSSSAGGVWIINDSRFEQNNKNVIYNSSKGHNTYPMNFTGNLREGNCTTLLSDLTPTYSKTFFFRVENRNFKATASCNPLKIKVQGKTFKGS